MKYIKTFESDKYTFGEYVMFFNKMKRLDELDGLLWDKLELAEILALDSDRDEYYIEIKEDGDELWVGADQIRKLTDFEKDTLKYNL